MERFDESHLRMRLWALVRLLGRIPPPVVEPAQALLTVKELLRGKGWHLREIELCATERPRVWVVHVRSPRLPSPFRVLVCNRTSQILAADFDLADLRGGPER